MFIILSDAELGSVSSMPGHGIGFFRVENYSKVLYHRFQLSKVVGWHLITWAMHWNQKEKYNGLRSGR